MSHSIRKRNRRRKYHEQTLVGAFKRAWKQGLTIKVMFYPARPSNTDER